VAPIDHADDSEPMTYPTATQAPTGTTLGRAALVTLGGVSAAGPLVTDLYLPALPDLARSLGSSEATAQLTLSVSLVGLALGQLVAGPLSDRVGRMRPLRWGVLLLALTSFLCAVAPTMQVLLGLRLVQGLCGAAALVVARAVIRDVYQGARAAKVFSELVLVVGLAPVVAPILGGQLLRFTDWRGEFVALGVIGVLLLVASWLTLAETHQGTSAAAAGPWRAFGTLLTDPRFLGYMVMSGLLGVMLFSYISMSPFVLRDRYGLSPVGYSLAFGCNAVGMIVGGRVNALVVLRRGPSTMLLVGLLLASVSSIAVAVALWKAAPLAVLLVPLWLVLASIGLSMGNAMALALTPHGMMAGTASALLGASQFLLGGLVPPVASLGGVGGPVMGVTMTVAALAALSTLMALRHRWSPATAARVTTLRPLPRSKRSHGT
jgi:MFS transporter, DHA1 family, multidrug resistance protein